MKGIHRSPGTDNLLVRVGPEAFTKHVGGVRRAALELIGALDALGVSVQVPGHLATRVDMTSDPLRAVARLRLQMHEMAFPYSSAAQAARGVQHSLYYDAVWPTKRWPLVITVHDMIHERFATGTARLRWAKRAAVRRANRIVTPSEATAEDLRRWLPVMSDIVVIPHGLSPSFLTEPGDPPEEPEPYLLYVGSRSGYKNFGLLYDAWSSRPTLQGHRLMAVGGGTFNAQERQRFGTAVGRGRLVHRDRVSETALVALYREASAAVVPSLYEGFGLPVIEAMASGTPVACSDGGSLAEVAAGHAVLFPADSPNACADAIELALERSEGERASARAHARGFTWETTARAHVDLYKELLD